MKLITFVQDGMQRPGALVARDGREWVVDLQRADAALPGSVRAILEAGAPALERAASAVAEATEFQALADLSLAAPIPDPGKILCIGLNYADHAAESGQPLPDHPIVFSKYNNTVIGSGQAIVLPKVTDQVDYEAELGFVIGKRARYVSEDYALDYVAGYTVVNDVSARDYQTRTSQWTMGKTFDTFAPMGAGSGHGRRSAGSAQSRHPPLDRGGNAAGLQHQPVNLQRAAFAGGYQRGDDFGAGRYCIDWHAARCGRGAQATALAASRRDSQY